MRLTIASLSSLLLIFAGLTEAYVTPPSSSLSSTKYQRLHHGSISKGSSTINDGRVGIEGNNAALLDAQRKSSSALSALKTDGEESLSLPFKFGFNPLFGTLWIGLVAYAAFFTPGSFDDPETTAILTKFMDDPFNSGLNELFLVIFNFFVVIPIVLANVILPGTVFREEKSLSPTPFLLASLGAGYFALGPYLMLRDNDDSMITTKSDLGWFTSNVLENKIVNYIVLAIALSVPVTSGVFQPSFDFGQAYQDYQSMLATSKFVSVSTADLSMLTIVSALLIPDDLKRRGVEDETKQKLIAAASLLLPVIGGSLYCALRPELSEE